MIIKYTKRVVTETPEEIELEDLLGRSIFFDIGDHCFIGYLIPHKGRKDYFMLWDEGCEDSVEEQIGLLGSKVMYYWSEEHKAFVSDLDDALLSALSKISGCHTAHAFKYLHKAVRDYLIRRPYTAEEVAALETQRTRDFQYVLSLANPMVEIYYKRNPTKEA